MNEKVNWRTQLLLPSFVATVLTLFVNLCVSLVTEHNKQVESTYSHHSGFTQLLTAEVLHKSQAMASTYSAEGEQQASTALLALDGLAESESEHAAVLLVGGRLVNANLKNNESGGPAARYLDVAIGNIKDRAASEGPFTQRMYTHLLQFVQSDAFVDLVSAGYATQYFKDRYCEVPKCDPDEGDYEPTRTGDTDIGFGAKDRLLALIGPNHIDGWIHVASWTVRDSTVSAGKSILTDAAAVVAAAIGKRSGLGELQQYAAVKRLVAAEWIRPSPSAQHVQVLFPRLLRDRAPLTYMSADGAVKIGTLGRVIGVVPAGACVEAVGAARPVIVYVPSKELNVHKSSETMEALIHLWVHVQDSTNCGS
jgi:hypothetical protein